MNVTSKERRAVAHGNTQDMIVTKGEVHPIKHDISYSADYADTLLATYRILLKIRQRRCQEASHA